MNSPHKDQWRGAFMFSLVFTQINDWVNNHEAGDLIRYRAYYDVIVMVWNGSWFTAAYVTSRLDPRFKIFVDDMETS